jgi:hypothetical protein
VIATIRRHPWLTRLALIVLAMLVAILAGLPADKVLVLTLMLLVLGIGIS